ncbi:MAG TPA: TRAP transporter small permease [Gammaproteobacteria bacterium]|nr:TRAP transporter small permease [Gammaproteobacteria bacterium]
MTTLQRLHDHLVRLESWLAAGSLLLLLLLTLLQILARNLFDAGLAGADTLTRYLVLYVTFFGAALAVGRNRHIRIDLACTLLSPTAMRRLYRPLRAIAALVCALFCVAAIRFWQDDWLYSPADERWLVLVSLVIPLGFGLLTLEFLLAAIIGPEDEDTCCPL